MISQKRLGLLFVLIGPPGVGKNTLMNRVLARLDDLYQLPTATTRPMRPNEQQGREHLFVSRDEFQQMDSSGKLIESQVIHGELYGIPRATVVVAIAVERDLIADIDVLGATYLRSVYPDNTVLVFVQPPSVDVLKNRMQTRGETQDEIDKRLRRVEMEMSYAPLCDYLIINDDDIDRASEILHSIVIAERSHRALLNLRAAHNLPRHRFTYVTTVVPIFDGEVLVRDESPHFPYAQHTHGEFPQDAALRALRQDLQLNAAPEGLNQADNTPDAFSFPIALETTQQENYQQLGFYYLYTLHERIQPPAGWTWIPYTEAGLPGAVHEAVSNLLKAQPRMEVLG